MAINDYFKMQRVINGLDLSRPVYKYIPLKYVITMLKTQKLYVGKVKKWEDTYENFLLKQDFVYDNRHLSADNLMDQIYGQCWTLLSESDVMWRIYSNPSKMNDIAIRIKTTAQRLFDAVYTSDDCMATTSIGSVEYVYKKEILQWIKGLHMHTAQDIGNNIVPSLYKKRKPFSHESEVRIIIMHDQDMGEGLSYDITPATMFDDFVIDPRLDTSTVNKIAKKLINLGINVNKIKQSQLYTFTPSLIKL